ncbi:MAG: hypothetical protein ABIT83_20070 [Massilia sp.]
MSLTVVDHLEPPMARGVFGGARAVIATGASLRAHHAIPAVGHPLPDAVPPKPAA